MSKKPFKKATKPQAREAAAKQFAADYPQEQDLNGQQQRLRKAAAAGADALKSGPTAMPRLALTPAAVSSKPLPPLAAPQGTLTPAQMPATQVQKTPAAAARSEAALALTTMSPKPAAQSTPRSQEKAALVAEALTPPAPKTVKHKFAFFEPDAKQVSLCGDFNRWSPDAAPMMWREGGRWETTLALPPGRYQYKFVVDGQWLHDPNAQENLPNPHGSLNSVMDVRI